MYTYIHTHTVFIAYMKFLGKLLMFLLALSFSLEYHQSLSSQVGEEKMRIERPGGTNSPIWSLAWNPAK